MRTGSQPEGKVNWYPSLWSVNRAAWLSISSRDVPFREILGVGVSICVAVGDGVAVERFAPWVCFAEAVRARDVSTPVGCTVGAGAARPQPYTVNRSMDPIKME